MLSSPTISQERPTIPAVWAPNAQLRWGFPELFVISLTVLPALLYLPGTQPLRVPIRIGGYTLSLIALGMWAGRKRSPEKSHPSHPWLLAALGYLVIQIFHPHTNTVLAGLAQVMLYTAILAPVFWAPPLIRTPGRLRRLLAILLICNGANAVVGILQVYNPARWLPHEFTTVAADSVMNTSYIGPDGRRIIRPPGLSDSPGAVCGPAATAALLGLVFCVGRNIAAWQRIGALALSFTGIAAIYLTQVRSSLIVTAGCVIAYMFILVLQRERTQALAILGLATLALFGALAFATMLGGDIVVKRFSSLFAQDPATVYYENRGNQVEVAFQEGLKRYPLGAGLARWGMMRSYFGDEKNINSPPIWAEIQFPAWLLDGGIVLLVLYCIGLLRAIGRGWSGSRNANDPLVRQFAAVVFAANLGTLALLFSFVPFNAPVGMQFWFLAGSLYGVMCQDRIPAARQTFVRSM